MDAFYASPWFPRLLGRDAIRESIVRGVENGTLAYVGKKPDGTYQPFYWQTSLGVQDVEISEDMFIIQRGVVERYEAAPGGDVTAAGPGPGPGPGPVPPSGGPTPLQPPLPNPPVPGVTTVPTLTWKGEVPPQKWMNFYTKVLSRFSTGPGLKLTLCVQIAPPEGVPVQRVEETKVALRELGLKDTFDEEP